VTGLRRSEALITAAPYGSEESYSQRVGVTGYPSLLLSQVFCEEAILRLCCSSYSRALLFTREPVTVAATG